jgi:hypothetical protein
VKLFLSKKAGFASIFAFTLVLLFSGLMTPNTQVSAAVHSCRNNTTCRNASSCTGDYYSLNGCTVQCYKDSAGDSPGQIEPSGSANCAGGATGGGGGGTGGGGPVGFYYGDGGSAYCSENWMWDAACSGPDDSYAPMAGFGAY